MSSSLFLIFIPNHSTELRRSKEGWRVGKDGYAMSRTHQVFSHARRSNPRRDGLQFDCAAGRGRGAGMWTTERKR